MLTASILKGVKSNLVPCMRRNIGVWAPVCQKAAAVDPIQKLFIDKIREYNKKSKEAGGKLVDATPETEKDLHGELDKVLKQYGGTTEADLITFPKLEFKEPTVDSTSSQ